MKIVSMRRKRKETKADMIAVLCLIQSVAVILAVVFLFILSYTDNTVFNAARQTIMMIFSEDMDIGGYFTPDDDGRTQPLPGGLSYMSFVSDGNVSETVNEASVEEKVRDDTDEMSHSVYEEAVLPVSGVITSDYGYREHPVYSGESFHSGRDIAADEGTPIYSVLDGTVTQTGTAELAGNYVKIEHADGSETFYCHCSEVLVSSGMKVKKGEVIALVGQTGLATGPHLHFELRENGVAVDPSKLLEEATGVY